MSSYKHLKFQDGVINVIKKDKKLFFISQSKLFVEISDLINHYKEKYRFTNLKPHIRNETEYIITLISGIWLTNFQKLKNERYC